MKQAMLRADRKPVNARVRQRANARTALLLLLALLVGMGVGAVWVYRTAQKPAATNDPAAHGLTDGTRAVLRSLNSSVEIRFYSLLGDESASGELREFAGRVQLLLTEFQRESGNKLKITPYETWTEANSKTASADGVVPFSLEQAEPVYLGLTVLHDKRKETIAQLNPEWEQALEFDLARAIARVANPSSLASTPAAASAADRALVEQATQEVERSIPNLASVSLEDGKRILRESALKEFKTAVAEMEKEVEAARQRLLKAEGSNSESDRQKALDLLQQVQAKHSETLSQIAARAKARTEALQRLKQQ